MFIRHNSSKESIVSSPNKIMNFTQLKKKKQHGVAVRLFGVGI
jgi:hypothetical protein